MDMTDVMVILLIACLILISICLGLALGVLLMLRRRTTQGTNRAVESAGATSEVGKLEQPTSQNPTRFEEQIASIHKDIRGESVRQLILAPSGIAIGMAIAFLTPSSDPIAGTVLAIAGLFGLLFGLSAPGRWLTRKLRFAKKRK